jgi:hypothetical protein
LTTSLSLDKTIADRWKRRTRDNDKHVLSAADVESARTTAITEKEGSAIVMMFNASVAADGGKSYAAFDRIPHKGRFRSFLLASLQIFLSTARRREHTIKRGADARLPAYPI